MTQTTQAPSAGSERDSTRSAGDSISGAIFRLTNEECLAAAAHLGAQSFPGVDASFLDFFSAEQRVAALRVAQRSLEVRDAFTPGELRDVLRLATDHDLLIVVSKPSSSHWLARRDDQLVVATLGPQSTVAMRMAPAESLVATLLENVTDLAHVSEGQKPAASAVQTESVATGGDSIVTSTAELDQLRLGKALPESAALSALSAQWAEYHLVRSVFRVGSAIAGGEVEWLSVPTGGCWLIERRESSVRVTPATVATLTSKIEAVLPSWATNTPFGARE